MHNKDTVDQALGLSTAGWSIILLAGKYGGDATHFVNTVHLADGVDLDEAFEKADEMLSRMKRRARPFSAEGGAALVSGTLAYPRALYSLVQQLHQDGYNVACWCRHTKEACDYGHLSLRPWPEDKVDIGHGFGDLKRELWLRWDAAAHGPGAALGAGPQDQK